MLNSFRKLTAPENMTGSDEQNDQVKSCLLIRFPGVKCIDTSFH